MKFLLDQNLSPKTTQFLKSLQLDAVDVRDVGLSGQDDDTIYRYALQHRFVLITYDHEFSYKYLANKDLEGLIFLRLHPQLLEIVHDVLKKFFLAISEEKIHKSIVVLERHQWRIRRVQEK